MPTDRRYIVKFSCPDQVGIVSAVSTFTAEHGGWIAEAHQHSSPESGRFFMRQEILAESLSIELDVLREKFQPLAKRFAMDWTISDTAQRERVVLLVSKQDHCLNDLLYRWRSGEMEYDLRCVISNHEDTRGFVEWHGVPFHHVPIDKADRETGFRKVGELIKEADAQTIVLARYMQVLPAWMCEQYPGQILNIHHSFLPSFVGARPYHQAHARGVKFVGATCHYVTADLDEGPIIEQDAIRTHHAHSVDELTRLGRDVEKAVLARGLRLHLQDRVQQDGIKTVVFD